MFNSENGRSRKNWLFNFTVQVIFFSWAEVLPITCAAIGLGKWRPVRATRSQWLCICCYLPSIASLIFLWQVNYWRLCYEPVLLHNLAVAPETHQPGSGKLHDCSVGINKICVWAFRERNVYWVYGSFMINEEGIVFSKWMQVFILTWNSPVIVTHAIAVVFLGRQLNVEKHITLSP